MNGSAYPREIFCPFFSSQASNGFGLLDDLVSKIVDEDQSMFGYANGSLSSDSSHESRANSDMFAYDRWVISF